MQRLTSQFGAVSFGVRAAACTAIGDCLSVIMPEEKEALKADLIRIKKGICTTSSTQTNEELWDAKLCRSYCMAHGRCKVSEVVHLCESCAAADCGNGRDRCADCKGCAYGLLQECWKKLRQTRCDKLQNADGTFRKLVGVELDAYFYKLSLPMVKQGWLCGMDDTPEHRDITKINERNGAERLRHWLVLALLCCHSI